MSLGHGIADEVLRETARRLSDACRPGESVARLGASRYLVLIDREHAAPDLPRVAASLVGSSGSE